MTFVDSVTLLLMDDSKCPWTKKIFTPLTKEEQKTIVEAMNSCGVRNASDRFAAQEARRGWGIQEEKITIAKEWIKKNCCEKSCEKDRDPDCFSCQAWDFLESL